MRKKTRRPRVEPSAASVPHGQYFSFRLAEPADLTGYKIHWFCNGRRLPGAHKTELSFFQVRAKYEGVYKAVIVKGSEALASNTVTLKALPQNAEAVIVAEAEESGTNGEGFFFDPLAPEDLTEPEPPMETDADANVDAAEKKKTFLKKALSKTKKVA
jgi:hypothetical protein